MLTTHLKSQLLTAFSTLYPRLTTSDDETLISIFSAIRAGYNSLNGFILPASPHTEQFSHTLKQVVDSVLERHKKLSPGELLELNELIRRELCSFERTFEATNATRYNQLKNRIDNETSRLKADDNALPKYRNSSYNKHNKPSPFFSIYPTSHMPYIPWYYQSPVTIVNNVVGGNNNQGNQRRNQEEDKPSIIAIIAAILTLAAIISAGVLSAIYALNKAYKSTMNIASGSKVIRGVCRLAAIAAGAYFGVIVGGLAGASLGAMIPGFGALAGTITASFFSIGIGAAFGAFVSKHVGRLASWLLTGDTNPEKWSLSSSQDEALLNTGFTRGSITEIEILIAAIRSIKSNASAEDKIQLNQLLGMLKKGEIQGPFMLEGRVYRIEAPRPIVSSTASMPFMNSQWMPGQTTKQAVNEVYRSPSNSSAQPDYDLTPPPVYRKC